MIYNEDCITEAKRFADESVDLGIYDPPFGINETQFDKHYKRQDSHVLDGYVEAPKDYYQFSSSWIQEAKRILKPHGSMYIVSGWSNLKDILNAVDDAELETINHIIWKFNFGVATKRKFVTSHYHILYLAKKGANTKFNTYCRFGAQERNEKGGSLNYQDMEDVFEIKKDYKPQQIKNKNKLPDALIEKLVLYSSDEGNVVCDFFQGNFTTALVSKRLGRKPVGFELNKNSYDHWMPILENTVAGCGLGELKVVKNIKPANQGKAVTKEEADSIVKDYKMQCEKTCEHCDRKYAKKDAISYLRKKYGRGRFGIKNILDQHLN